MGLFDPPSEEKLSEVYPPGTPFMLYSGEYDGRINTEFGPSHCATVTAGALDRSGEPKQFKVFGKLAEQFRQLKSTDLPAAVTIEQKGRAFTWKQVGAPEEIPF